jgi:hypothetical protein
MGPTTKAKPSIFQDTIVIVFPKVKYCEKQPIPKIITMGLYGGETTSSRFKNQNSSHGKEIMIMVGNFSQCYYDKPLQFLHILNSSGALDNNTRILNIQYVRKDTYFLLEKRMLNNRCNLLFIDYLRYKVGVCKIILLFLISRIGLYS